MIIDIFIIFIIILLNGVFTCAELAILSVNKTKVRQKADEGDKKAILIKEVLSQTETFLPTVAITYTIMGLFVGTYSGLVFSEPLTNWLLSIGNLSEILSSAILEGIVAIFITVTLSYFTLIFAEIVPKRLAISFPEKVAYVMVGLIVVIVKVLRPLVVVVSSSSSLVIALMGIKSNKENDYATEEDIRMMVDEGGEVGNIDEEEKEMIKNIFAFDDKIAEEIATHRTDIVSLDIEDGYDEILKVLSENHSRIPVYEEDIDHIIGVLHARDLMKYLMKMSLEGGDIDIRPLLRKPNFVPSSKKLNQLFREMKKEKITLSIVVDEYGGTLGIVTMEDLIEEVMGSISDEYDTEEGEDIEKIDKQTYVISGTASLERVNEELNFELPVEEYDTLGGFVIGQIGRIPNNEEEVELEFNGATFKVRGVHENRIQQLVVKSKVDGTVKKEDDEWIG